MGELVSIIVPAFNYGHLIGYTLESIRNQEYQYWECIIIDDGSSDNTRQLSLSYLEIDERFSYHYQENRGLSAARNNGIGRANGVFIQFLDADDLLGPKKLKRQVSISKSNTKIDLIFGPTYFFSDQAEIDKTNAWTLPLKQKLRPVAGEQYNICEKLLQRNILPVNAAMINKRVFEKLDLFDEAFFSCEDWDLWLRMSISGFVFFYDEDLEGVSFVRKHEGSMITVSWKMFFYESKLRIKNHDLLKSEVLISLNKKLLKDSNKSTVYSLVDSLPEPRLTILLNEFYGITKSRRIQLLIFFKDLFGGVNLRMVWFLFESPWNAIKAKLRFE